MSVHTLDTRVVEYKSLSKQITVMNARLAALRVRKRESATHIHRYMIAAHLDIVDGIKLSQVKPPLPKSMRMTATQKKDNAIALFQEAGVPQADKFWEQLQLTQKRIPEVQSE